MRGESGIECECASRAVGLHVIPLDSPDLASEPKRVASGDFCDARRNSIRVVRVHNDGNRVEVVHPDDIRFREHGKRSLSLVLGPARTNLREIEVAAGHRQGSIVKPQHR